MAKIWRTRRHDRCTHCPWLQLGAVAGRAHQGCAPVSQAASPGWWSSRPRAIRCWIARWRRLAAGAVYKGSGGAARWAGGSGSSAQSVPTGRNRGSLCWRRSPREQPLGCASVSSRAWHGRCGERGRGGVPRCWRSFPPSARLRERCRRPPAEILALRPDLQIVPLRGNVDTRLRKLS